jgi:di/tricarboxylate transporter
LDITKEYKRSISVVTLDIALVLFILTISVIFLITEKIPMEVTALLTLGAVALTGLVSPADALSGFSNPAVVTIWAVFILSGGLTRTGVANVIGNFVMRLAGKKETTLIMVIMTTAGVMSAIMNNVAVAALMLPVVMDIARHTGCPPSRLLMPLAYGCLLGGLTTQIGTPPNILVSEALDHEGLHPFGFFDFTPVGLIVMVTGILFMMFIGRHLLPRRDVVGEEATGGKVDRQVQYGLEERLFHVRVPPDSVLINKSLAQIRMGSILGWNVIGITRGDRTLLAPKPSDILLAGDLLTVEGRVGAVKELGYRHKLVIEQDGIDLQTVYTDDLRIGEVQLPADSRFVGNTLNGLSFRKRFGLNVLAIRRKSKVVRIGLADERLQAGDFLLLAGRMNLFQELADTADFGQFRLVDWEELEKAYHLHETLMVMRVPEDSPPAGQTLKESRLAEVLGSRVLGIFRDDGPLVLPEPEEVLQPGDRLVVEGGARDLNILRGLEKLEIEHGSPLDIQRLISGDFGLVEAILSPQTTLEGQTLRRINFREKFGVNVLALWRRGHAYRSDLRDMELRLGDALLLLGPLSKLRMLGQEPDFIVLSEMAREEMRREKMKISVTLLVLVLAPVIMGWVPIYIAVVVGAAFMILTGCLTMEEAYRQIEWKAVFLIAGMLPLGTALDQTGAAKLIAAGVISLVGPLGPNGVMFGLVALTFLATCFVPTAALVVLMAPIVFSTSSSMGLSPHGLLMAVAMAASASFMTPVSHPANTLIMGPGGYRFSDYFKVGGLLTLVIFGVLMLVLPIFWPLNP